LAQRLIRQGAPYSRYGPQSRGYACSIEWQLLGGHLGDHQLPFGVDEQVLSVHAEAEQQRSVTVIDVPFAAIAGARETRGKITHGPGLRVAAGSDFVNTCLPPRVPAFAISWSTSARSRTVAQMRVIRRQAAAAGITARSAATRSAPPGSPPTSPTAARSSTAGTGRTRKPAYDQVYDRTKERLIQDEVESIRL